MKKTLRIRERKVDVELTLWKFLPMFFLILLIVASTIMGSASPGGGMPPMCD